MKKNKSEQPEKKEEEKAKKPIKKKAEKAEIVAEQKPQKKQNKQKPQKPQKPKKGKTEEPKKEETSQAETKAPKNGAPVFDMTAILGEKSAKKAVEKTAEKSEQPKKSEEKAETATPEKKTDGEKKSGQGAIRGNGNGNGNANGNANGGKGKPVRAQKGGNGNANGNQSAHGGQEKNADERLKEAFLKKLRSLGGEYFEYYSVYLLERYARKYGRRLEAMKISGGEKDGGIDGEIEVSDKLGFRETIYVQAKNWNPTRSEWIVGETLLQQFVGAVLSRQARDGKRRTRGIFMTTSVFSSDAKAMLSAMSADFVGYDGSDVFDAAKECRFGVKEENGRLVLDEKLLSGTDAFYEM